MTFRQKILKAVYPFFAKLAGMGARDTTVLRNKTGQMPPESIYDLEVALNTGEVVSLSQYRGRKLLIVNTASDCGYTGQYAELQDLHERYPQFAIMAFPANDFKGQESRSDSEIAAFCKASYGLTFPIATKASVIRGPSQQPVFRWLTDRTKNGWCAQQPSWNFSKYLVDEQGRLVYYFGPAILPSGAKMNDAINY